MKKEEVKEKIKGEFIQILTGKYGLSDDEEAKKILREMLFGKIKGREN